MFNTGMDKNYSLKQNLQINPLKESNQSSQSVLNGNIFEDNASKYAIQVADKDTKNGFPVSRDPLGGLNLSGKPQSDLAPAPIEKDGGLKVTTYPEGGLNMTGDPKMIPPTLKAPDQGTRLLTNPDGSLNLTGKPVPQQLTIPSASGKVDFPDDTPVPDNQFVPGELPSADKQIDFPGNSDLTDDILSGNVLPNKKYIITFPDDEPVAPKTIVPQTVTPKIVEPKIITPKVAPVLNPPVEKAPVKAQTITPKVTAPMRAVSEATPRINRPIPDASTEIKSLYGQKMCVKNQRLYKLIRDNEYNPQLKEYLLTCRVDDLVQKVNAMNPEYITHFNNCCEKYKITNQEDKLTLLAQMQQESNLNQNAESHSGAFGFMQIMPGTAALMNKEYYRSSDSLISWNRKMDYKNPFDNIEMGVALMAANIRKYRNTERPILTALGAYNAGTQPTDAFLYGTALKTKKGIINPEGAKTLYGIPPYDEPQLYYQIIPTTQDFMLRHPEKIQTISSLLNSAQK